jgi:3,4-dihydroxy 2-butanone 4-phosphate synthase / GTP cyclohydrolase II
MNIFNTIEETIHDLREGKIIIVVDDEDRENEGDFICSAEKITPESINFMVTHGRGMLCAPITSKRAKELQLEPMVGNPDALHGTNFLVTIDSKIGTTTGISAGDRAKTIRDIVDHASTPDTFARPGHIFPLLAVEGGVLRRAGHTEAVVDLMRISGLYPAGVLCEIMNEDGSMARVPQLAEIAKKFNLKLITVKSLIEYRIKREKLVTKVVEVNLPTKFGNFKLHCYKNNLDGKEHLALTKGIISSDEPALVRVHSECFTGDVLGSLRCDCNEQLHRAMEMIEKNGSGIIVYMRQEGRGIGLTNKLKAYQLQESGLDTVEANEALGFAPDPRDYGLGAQILVNLGVRKMKLITNNPQKRVGLESYGLEIVERIPIEIHPNKNNEEYLKTKRDKLGHLILMNKS